MRDKERGKPASKFKNFKLYEYGCVDIDTAATCIPYISSNSSFIAHKGVVWEESIILLPHRVRFVFLSATIPNAKEFVSWVSKLHHQPCHVVYTEYRCVTGQSCML